MAKPEDGGRYAGNATGSVISGWDLEFATLALVYYAQARVVPEDGTSASVSLTMIQAPI